MLNDNLAYKLQNSLMGAVNGEISPKAKEHLNTRQYFEKRNAIEDEIIINTSFAYSFFENEATLEEIKQLDPTLFNPKTLMLCVISALKGYISQERETDLKCLVLHNLYLLLKQQLSSEIPFPEGDGFTEYINSKAERLELENTRSTGSVCLACGSHNVHSKGAEFQCFDCEKRWRKH